jgi:hypothetical protein
MKCASRGQGKQKTLENTCSCLVQHAEMQTKAKEKQLPQKQEHPKLSEQCQAFKSMAQASCERANGSSSFLGCSQMGNLEVAWGLLQSMGLQFQINKILEVRDA